MESDPPNDKPGKLTALLKEEGTKSPDEGFGQHKDSPDDGFDKVMAHVGSRGIYQTKLIYGFMVPVCFVMGYNMCQILFQVAVPRYWCSVPGRNNTLLDIEAWKELTIPKDGDHGGFSSCSRYIVDWDPVDSSTYHISNQTQECLDGWDFDNDQFSATVATSFNWFCKKEQYSYNILTINAVGNVIGTFTLPLLADNIGRRPSFFIVIAIHIVFTVAYIWTPYYNLQLLFRFFRGFTEYSMYFIPYSTVLEVSHPDDRSRATTISWMGWMGGMCFTALMAWLMPNWQHLALSTLPASILIFLYWNHFPESPRWLLSKRRVSECADILIMINKSNRNCTITKDELETMLKILLKTKEEKVSFLNAFKYPRLRLRTIMIIVMNFCLYLVYGSTLYGINVLQDNQFLSHFVLSISELPSNFVGWLLIQYLGRRMSCYSTICITIVFSIVKLFYVQHQWVMLAIASVTKFLVTTTLYCMYVIIGETFPTPIRSSAFGITNVAGLTGLSVVPVILHGDIGPTVMHWILLGCLVVSLFASLAIPETLGLSLPQTFQEAQAIGSSRPLTTFVHHWNYKKYMYL